MITIVDFTKENWKDFEDKILNSELVYPPQIRSTKEDFFDVLGAGDAIAKIAMLESQYIGNIIGYPLCAEYMKYHDMQGEQLDSKIIYVFNFVVDPSFQGKGFGQKLLLEFIRCAKAKGYDKVVGHWRKNGALFLIKHLGGTEILIHKNWHNTGEDYILCELDLNKPIVA